MGYAVIVVSSTDVLEKRREKMERCTSISLEWTESERPLAEGGNFQRWLFTQRPITPARCLQVFLSFNDLLEAKLRTSRCLHRQEVVRLRPSQLNTRKEKERKTNNPSSNCI